MGSSNLGSIKSAAMKAINTALKRMEQPIKDVESLKVEEVVYGSYPQPSVYERRQELGNPANMEATYESTGDGASITVSNKAKFNPFTTKGVSRNSGEGLAQLVEGGDGAGGYSYDYHTQYETEFEGETANASYLEPRPFIQATRDEIDGIASLYVVDALSSAGFTIG